MMRQPAPAVKDLVRILGKYSVAVKVKPSYRANVEGVAADILNRVARAADEIARLEPRLRRAREELHAAIREAAREGVSLSVIARVAGISRQRVAQLVAEERRRREP
jgi:hypothetical protein